MKRQLKYLLSAWFHEFYSGDILNNIQTRKMWPIVMAAMRRNAPFITLPFAAIVGLYQLH